MHTTLDKERNMDEMKNRITVHLLTTVETINGRSANDCILPTNIFVLRDGRAVAVYENDPDQVYDSYDSLCEGHDHIDKQTLLDLPVGEWGYDLNEHRVTSMVGEEYTA